MPAGVMAWTLLSFPFGVALYTNVFVAQYHGAKQPSKIGSVIWHGLVLATLFSPLFLTSVIWPAWPFLLSGHEGAIAEQEATYFRFVSIGSMAHIYGGVLTSFFIGLGRTKIVMFVDVFVCSVKCAAGLDPYLWIDDRRKLHHPTDGNQGSCNCNFNSSLG